MEVLDKRRKNIIFSWMKPISMTIYIKNYEDIESISNKNPTVHPIQWNLYPWYYQHMCSRLEFGTRIRENKVTFHFTFSH